MGNWRDIFLYAYDATGRIDEMAEDMAAQRKARMEEWRMKRDAAEEQAKAHWEERKKEMKEHQEAHMKKIVAEANLATKDDIAALKKQIDALAKKLK
jgi:hypothetical protein